MTRAVAAIAIVGLSLSFASASVAAEAEDAPKLLPEKGRKNPYASLFTGSGALQQQPPVERDRQAEAANTPKVVCGMVMIPADGGIDPHMRKSPPQADNTKHTIRAVKPPMCTSP